MIKVWMKIIATFLDSFNISSNYYLFKWSNEAKSNWNSIEILLTSLTASRG